jgi:hypothetical protein
MLQHHVAVIGAKDLTDEALSGPCSDFVWSRLIFPQLSERSGPDAKWSPTLRKDVPPRTGLTVLAVTASKKKQRVA